MDEHIYNRSVDVATMPDRIRRLPISPTGFPVPWFVEWFQIRKPCPAGDGVPDFRVVDPTKMAVAVKKNRCWVCGQPRSVVFKAFVIGPMCALSEGRQLGDGTREFLADYLEKPEISAPHTTSRILTTPAEIETWMTAPAEEALKLQRPLPDGGLAIVARGERKDEAVELA